MSFDFALLANSFQLIISFLPNIIGGIVIALIGIFLGNLARKLTIKGLQMLKIESIVEDTKFKSFLIKAEITQKIEEIIAGAIKWIIVLTFFIASMNVIGLDSVSNILSGILGYIPNVISAMIVLTIGVLLAGLIESVVKGALSSVDLKTARLMGKIASYTVVTIAILAAFSELKIAENFINILFIGFVSMLTLGFGLAIGLGAKDVVGKMLSDWYKDLQKELKK